MVQVYEPAQLSARSPRVERLYARLWEGMLAKRSWWGDGLNVLDDPETAAKSVILRKAAAIAKVLREMPVAIVPDEPIVGLMTMGSLGWGRVFPEYATAEEKAAAAENALSPLSVFGHSVPDYARVLSEGIEGLRRQVEDKHAALPDDESAERQRNFYAAALVVLEAVTALAARYADVARAEALIEEYPGRRAELEEIAAICERVPEKPARTFREALQSFWFVFTALHSTMTAAPIGRLDYYLGPYLERDLAEGRLTVAEAQELVDCLWIKFNERTQLLEEHHEWHADPYKGSLGGDPNSAGAYVFGMDKAYANHWLQNLILGGQTPEGEDSTNTLTYLCLNATMKFELTQPTVSVRLSPAYPEPLLRLACRVIQKGGGMPALFNDRVFVEAYRRLGFLPIEEIRGYSHDGCWETLIPGKTEYRWGPVHGLECVELALIRGRSRVTGCLNGLDTGDPADFASFDDFLAAFRAQLDHRVGAAVDSVAKYCGSAYAIAPEPLLSCLLDGCLERGRDITEGGARYIFHSLVISGLANTVDALAAIKRLVFEERRLTFAHLEEALASDFAGREPVRQWLINRAPKFGNDDDYVDRLAVETVAYFVDRVAAHAKRCPWVHFPAGSGAVGGMYREFGLVVGASPDGRHYQEAIAQTTSPMPGRDLSGPTAAVRSYVKIDHALLPTGSPLDLSLEPAAVRGEQGLERLMAFVRSFLALGGSVLTLTVTDVETLLAAQREPAKYRGLRVRMGGWQAYFTTLDREHQDHHIKRMKHRL